MIPTTSSLDPRLFEPAIGRFIESGYAKDQYYKDLVAEKDWQDVSPNYKPGVKSASFIPLREMRLKGETSPIEFDRVSPAFLLETEYAEYGLAIATSRVALEDDLHGVFQSGHTQLGESYNLLLNKQVARGYDALNTTTYFVGPDGKPIVSDIHPHPDAGVSAVWSNLMTSTSVPTYESIKQAIILGFKMTNLNGDPAPMWKKGASLTVVTDIDNYLETEAIVKAMGKPGPLAEAGFHDDNVLKNFNINVVMNPFLKGSGNANVPYWYVLGSDIGLELVRRRGLEKSVYKEPSNKVLVTDVTARHGFHPRSYQWLVGCGFATQVV